MQRRTFLRLSAATIATGAGCTQHPSEHTAPLPSAWDWQELHQALQGDVLLPDHADFARIAKSANARYDDQIPAAMIRCANSQDVQLSVLFLRRFQLPFAVRGGGHCYTGGSSTQGVLLDMSGLSAISLQDDVATIGAGAKLGDIYATLGAAGRSIPAGSCVSVGISGLALGGGLGIADRQFGLTCDAILRIRLVTADGKLLDCDANQHSELFWALCGGGGGQFGIVTEFVFQTFATAPIRNYIGRYPLADGETVLGEWQDWLQQLPNEVWSQATIWFSGNPNRPPEIQIRACSIGFPQLLTQHWQQLELRLAGVWSDLDMQDHRYLDFMLSDCAGLDQDQCKLPNQHSAGLLRRSAMTGSSDLFHHTIPASGLTQLLTAIRHRHQQGFRGGVMLTIMGGAIQHRAHHDTAFAHRKAILSAQYVVINPVGTAETVLAEAAQWSNQMRAVMKPWSSGGAYLNYSDSLLRDWGKAYYGDHYSRLQKIKQQYDPQLLFQGRHRIQ